MYLSFPFPDLHRYWSRGSNYDSTQHPYLSFRCWLGLEQRFWFTMFRSIRFRSTRKKFSNLILLVGLELLRQGLWDVDDSTFATLTSNSLSTPDVLYWMWAPCTSCQVCTSAPLIGGSAMSHCQRLRGQDGTPPDHRSLYKVYLRICCSTCINQCPQWQHIIQRNTQRSLLTYTSSRLPWSRRVMSKFFKVPLGP